MSPPSYNNETKIDNFRVKKLFQEYISSKSSKVREQIILLHLPVVRQVAQKYSRKGIPLESLISVGNIALVRAVDRYKLHKGASFSTYISAVIAGKIKHYFRKRSWGLKVPRQLQENFLRVNKIVEELTQELVRSPTIPEIASKANLSEEDVLESIEVGGAYRLVSLDKASISQDGDEFMLSDLIGAEDKQFERIRQKIDVEEILDYLDKRERMIVILCYYENLTQQQIARRLGISQMHVCRLKRQALKKLKKALKH